MQPHINDLSDFGVLNKMLLTGFFTVINEAIVSPLDRLRVRCMARQNHITQSFLHFRETNLVLKDIISKEKPIGMIYGFKGIMDSSATQNILRFLTYDFIMGRQKSDDLGIQIERKYRFSDIFFATTISSSVGALASQPSEILKIKVQLEPLGNQDVKFESYREKIQNILNYHNKNQGILFFPGLIPKLISRNLFFLTELGLFFELRHRLQLEEKFQMGYSQTLSYSLLAGFSSKVATLLTHPFEFLYHRYLIRSLQGFESANVIEYFKIVKQKEGLSGFYKGVLPAVLKNGLNSFILMGALQQFINYKGNDLMRRDFEKKQLGQKWKRGNE